MLLYLYNVKWTSVFTVPGHCGNLYQNFVCTTESFAGPKRNASIIFRAEFRLMNDIMHCAHRFLKNLTLTCVGSSHTTKESNLIRKILYINVPTPKSILIRQQSLGESRNCLKMSVFWLVTLCRLE